MKFLHKYLLQQILPRTKRKSHEAGGCEQISVAGGRITKRKAKKKGDQKEHESASVVFERKTKQNSLDAQEQV